MALRETRASWRRLLFFFVCIAVGVAATNSMDLYCGSLSTITIGQNLVPRWKPAASARAISPRR